MNIVCDVARNFDLGGLQPIRLHFYPSLYLPPLHVFLSFRRHLLAFVHFPWDKIWSLFFYKFHNFRISLRPDFKLSLILLVSILSKIKQIVLLVLPLAYYYYHFTALWILSGTTLVSRYQKGKTITNLYFLQQERFRGSGISWAICKSAPRPI